MLKCEKQHNCHGAIVAYYTHYSKITNCQMRFTISIPDEGKFSGGYIVFLSGLTCTEDNFTTKSGAYKKAMELGLSILAPDTSPRGDNVADDKSYDLGQGAGFYIDATEKPWNKNFNMESYIIKDLIPNCEKHFKLDGKRKSIMGHSMGGHGALTLYFKYPGLFKSCSAFAPIVAPSKVEWGQKAFKSYLGDDETIWQLHDASELVKKCQSAKNNNAILIDQGLADNFLQQQLKPEIFEHACKQVGQKLKLRMHEGYDHSYFFIQSFIDDHLNWHNELL